MSALVQWAGWGAFLGVLTGLAAQRSPSWWGVASSAAAGAAPAVATKVARLSREARTEDVGPCGEEVAS